VKILKKKRKERKKEKKKNNIRIKKEEKNKIFLQLIFFCMWEEFQFWG